MARNFPDFIDAYLEFTKIQEAAPIIHKWVGVSCIAAALERKVWMDRGVYLLFPNFYVIIVGQSGLVKKSTSTAIGVNLLRELDGLALCSERMSAVSFIQQMASSYKKFKYKDKEIGQSSLLIYATELKVFMEEVFGSTSELLTTFYDCQPYDHRKPWIYTSIAQGDIKIYGPCLNMLGASTPSWLLKCIPREDMEGGFASRCIFVAQLEPPTNPIAWPEHSKELSSKRKRLVEDLNEIYHITGPFEPDPQAKELYSRWYSHHVREVVPYAKDARFTGYLGRKGDQVLKLSMIKSASEGNSRIIKPEHIIWATESLDQLEPNMKRLFDSFDGPSKETAKLGVSGLTYRNLIIESIQQRGYIELRELSKIVRSPTQIDDFLKDLSILVRNKTVSMRTRDIPNAIPERYYFFTEDESKYESIFSGKP